MRNSVVKIENIVASGSVAEAIDLEYISNKITDCVLDTRRFPGAVYHIQNPKSTALIFESGRIVITGVRRPEDMAVALQKLLNTLKNAKITCHDHPQVAVKNIVCSYNLGNPNLNRIMIV